MNKVLLFAFILFYACNNKPPQAEEKKQEDRFFDVKHYLSADLNDIKATPYFIYKLDVINGRKDSVAIAPAQAISFAQGFLTPDINDPEIKKYYKENIFQDQSINSFTISYSTTNKQLPIQNLDVLLREDGKTVRRLFIRKFLNSSDSSTIEQWSWKPGESFEVNRLTTFENKPEVSHRTLIVWNPKEQ